MACCSLLHMCLSTSSSDVCVGLRLQQVLKSQWPSKALERSKPLKKLALKHKLSSKDKHKFSNSLMAVSKYTCLGMPICKLSIEIPHSLKGTMGKIILIYLFILSPLKSSKLISYLATQTAQCQ